MASSPKNRMANGMSTKMGVTARDDNGAPIKGTHREENIKHPGTDGSRVNGSATNGANRH